MSSFSLGSTAPLRVLSCRRARMSERRATSVYAQASRSGGPTQIKICGVTNPKDARTAVDAGADFIGMIMWPKAKRGVSDEAALLIAHVAKEGGATPVGVFVDEDADTINHRCKLAGIPVAQLHGDGAREAMTGLSESLQVVWVLHATPDGKVVTQLPSDTTGRGGRRADWLLIDGLQGGSGQALDWSNLQPPTEFKQGWLLAGGLNPGNVAEAVRLARPSVVDVSSGVCGPDGLRKDADKIASFIQAVRSTKNGGDSQWYDVDL